MILSPAPAQPLRLFVAVALVSAAVIAYQVSLMQILSIVQWHHFAATIIAIALLGFGASGTCIALLRRCLLSGYERVLPVLMVSSGLAMALAVQAAQSGPIRFDSYLLFAEPGHSYRLAAVCGCYFIPFFLAALAVGLVFARFVSDIKDLYCANLIGSGMGAALAVILMQRFSPESIPAIIALMPLLAGILIITHPIGRLAVCLPVCLAVWLALHPPRLEPSEFKDIERALDLPDAAIAGGLTSPMGYLQIVTSRALRYAPGVSLSLEGDLPVYPMVYKNGDWFGPLVSWNPALRHSILDYTTGAAAYRLTRPATVLVLDAGTGAEVVQGLIHARDVTAVESHPGAAHMLRRLSGDPDHRLRVYPLGARAFLRRECARYDLIVLPMANTMGGSSGIHALAENHLLTVEAFAQMWRRLEPGGMLSVSCWLDTPPRASLKLIATASTALGSLGVDPGTHIMALKSWGTFTMLVKRSSITDADIINLSEFCHGLAFDPLIPPRSAGMGNRVSSPAQEGWSLTAARLISTRGADVAYDFNIRPATDDRPYFSQFLTVRGLSRLRDLYGRRAVPFFELGYLILIITALLVGLLAVVLILPPLMMRDRPSRPLSTLLYFGGLGAGFLFLEIAMIQHALVYLGTPVYAAALVIGGMLSFSGCGSLASGMAPGAHRCLPAMVAVLILIYALGFADLLMLTSALPMGGRIAVLLLAIAPLAFCMGMPFPLGLARLPRGDVPWAWGVNGCLSVVSAPLAAIAAVEWGFSRVMLLAALAYAVAWLGGGPKRYA